MDEPRPHKVQKILHLEGKAATSRAEYESTLARITPAKHKAQQYDQEAKALKRLSPLRHRERCGPARGRTPARGHISGHRHPHRG
jgi:hypothetical protein